MWRLACHVSSNYPDYIEWESLIYWFLVLSFRCFASFYQSDNSLWRGYTLLYYNFIFSHQYGPNSQWRLYILELSIWHLLWCWASGLCDRIVSGWGMLLNTPSRIALANGLCSYFRRALSLFNGADFTHYVLWCSFEDLMLWELSLRITCITAITMSLFVLNFFSCIAW